MKKMFCVVAASLAIGTASLSAQTDFDDLSKGFDTFTEKVPGSLPFAAAAGMDWSNAWIGNLLDTDFPYVHFGLGISGGLTTIPASAVEPLVNAVGSDLGSLQYLPLPFTVISARIGGIVFPFDVGLKLGFLPSQYAEFGNYKINYTNFGIDARYRLVKSDFWLPDVSVGAGLNFMSASVKATWGEDTTFDDGTHTLTIQSPEVGMDLSAVQFEVKTQVSKTFFWFLTPYVGAGLGYGSGSAKAGIKADVTSNAPSLSYWKNKYGIDASTQGVSQASSTGVFGARLFGGTSINILVLKLDLQGSYSLFDGAFGATVGARVQL